MCFMATPVSIVCLSLCPVWAPRVPCIYHATGPVCAPNAPFTVACSLPSLSVLSLMSLSEGSIITSAWPQKPKLIKPPRGQLKVTALVEAWAEFKARLTASRTHRKASCLCVKTESEGDWFMSMHSFRIQTLDSYHVMLLQTVAGFCFLFFLVFQSVFEIHNGNSLANASRELPLLNEFHLQT